MNDVRIHRAVSADGTEIAGRVCGHGPPLVLVHGSLEDGDLDWASIVPFLNGQFTCCLMSTRNRGLSGEAVDLSPARRIEDVTAFIESIGEPVSVVGESDGGALALGAAARTNAISALAVYEPVVPEVADAETIARLEETFARVGEAAAEGMLAHAARIFSELVANEDELRALTALDYFNECARYIPTMLQENEDGLESDEPGPTNDSVLAKITAPVLVLRGTQGALRLLSTDGPRHVAEQLPDSQQRNVEGAGHFGVALAPQHIAEEVLQFFDASLRSA